MMKLLNTLFFASIFTLLIANENINELQLKYDNHSIKKYQTWNSWVDKKITERISAAPQNLIEYIKLDNELYGYDGTPKEVLLEASFKSDLISIIKNLPPQITQQMQKYLIGIFLISGLGSTGYSEHIYKGEDYYGGFIVFDQEILSGMKANEWASWRINSAFEKVDDYTLSLDIQTPSQNTTKEAIEFILLHEIGHIVGFASGAHPKTQNENPKKFLFSNISWISWSESMYDRHFTNRDKIKYYRFSKAKPDLKDAGEVIPNLKKTDFVSVYASNNFFEDYAEAYAIYVHTVLMKKPYSLKLKYKDKEIHSFENPFNKKEFKTKKEYFDNLFQKN